MRTSSLLISGAVAAVAVAGSASAGVVDQFTTAATFGGAGATYTTITGATNAAYRYNQLLTFAVPAPGAAALVGLAGLVGRRRR
ncbi:MAG: hypothetical protein FJ292_10455 [Planctomycetes bacterium]|nr:hypothetical protein [Planctomycetota bacterium]